LGNPKHGKIYEFVNGDLLEKAGWGIEMGNCSEKTVFFGTSRIISERPLTSIFIQQFVPMF
jgi:hypothetical protein